MKYNQKTIKVKLKIMLIKPIVRIIYNQRVKLRTRIKNKENPINKIKVLKVSMQMLKKMVQKMI